MNTITKEEIKSQIERETGKKISVTKNRGSMKHYTTFRVKGRVTHSNTDKFEFDFSWGREFIKQFPGAYFTNRTMIDIPNQYLAQ